MKHWMFVAFALALFAQRTPGCEICVEDQIAATYEYGVLVRAEAAGRNVLFAALRGDAASAPQSEAIVRQAISSLSGVDRSSIRLSAVPPAASFAWDPKRHAAGAILRAVNAKLAKNGLWLVALRVIGQDR
jgi:hypothetical protein